LEIFGLKHCNVSREFELNTEGCTQLKDLKVHIEFHTPINFIPPKVALEVSCLRELKLDCNIINPKCFKNLVTNLEVLALPWRDIYNNRTFASVAQNLDPKHRILDFSLSGCPKKLHITDSVSMYTLDCILPRGSGTFIVVVMRGKRHPRITQIFVLNPDESIIVHVDLKCY